MRRFIRTIVRSIAVVLCLAAVAACEVPAPPPPAPVPFDGFSEQHPRWGADPEGDPWSEITTNFAGVKYARFIIPPEACIENVKQWVATTTRHRLVPVITPHRDAATRPSCGDGRPGYWSDIEGWTSELAAMGVTTWTTLNEPNHPDSYLEPGWLALQWSRQQRAVRTHCGATCSLIVGEFATPLSATYLRTVHEALSDVVWSNAINHPNEGWRYPERWSLHDYTDVTGTYDQPSNFAQLNRLQGHLDQVASYMAASNQPYTPRIWLTEQAVLLSHDHSWTTVAGTHERQCAAARKFMQLRSQRLVERVFYYQWQGQQTPQKWDSGLVDNTGWQRPAMAIFKGGGCT
jgi:hypothetical protein